MPTQVSPGVVVAAGDLTTDSSTQQHNLGEMIRTTDGRTYRYAKAGGTALVPGKLQQSPVEITDHQNLTPAAAAAAATSVTVTLGSTAATVNQYAEGYLMVSITPGQGQLLKIKSHPAADASGSLVVTLSDPVVVALTTSSRVDLVLNAYSGVIINPATATSSPAGVCTYAITASQFGWLQVSGPCNVLADGSITVGVNVSASNGTNGAVEAAVTSQAAVGYAITGIATTDHGAVMLQMH